MFDNQYSWSNQKEKKTSDDFRFVLQAAPRINDSLNKQQLDLNLPTVAFHIFLSVLHFSRSSSVSKPPGRTLCRSHSHRRLDSPPLAFLSLPWKHTNESPPPPLPSSDDQPRSVWTSCSMFRPTSRYWSDWWGYLYMFVLWIVSAWLTSVQSRHPLAVIRPSLC